MVKWLLALSVSSLVSFSTFAQEGYWMTGGAIGVNMLRNDLSPDLSLNGVGGEASGIWLYGINSYVLLRNEIGAGYYRSGATRDISNPVISSITFNSVAFSASTGLQYDFLPYRKSNKDRKGTPYLFVTGGLSYAMASSAFVPKVDFGIGYKKSISYYWDLAFELSTKRMVGDRFDGFGKEAAVGLDFLPVFDLRNDRISLVSVSLIYHYIRVKCP